VAMNPTSGKKILPLEPGHYCATPVPLRAIYTLADPRGVLRKQPVRIEALSPRDAFLVLVENTFNYRITAASRLERQFREATRLVDSIPVRRLSYARNLHHLPAVREAVLGDLSRVPERLFMRQEPSPCAG
jgi:hypothetical protein